MATEHELEVFLRQDLAEISSEYNRIRAKAAEDPGTAGDEAEENWADLLRSWLPNSYKVVTKGRLLGVDGKASPQLDVIVLHSSYPERLLSKKVYLVHGVAAAFECKATLKAKHIAEAVETAKAIRRLSGARSGTPYRELVSPPLFGVLAHSHVWTKKASKPRENVDDALAASVVAATHPRELIDLVCVANLGCWNLIHIAYLGRSLLGDNWSELQRVYGLPDEGGCMSSYSRWDPGSDQPEPNPVAVLVSLVFQRLAWEDSSLRPMADYFRLAGLWGASQGVMSPWPLSSTFSPEVGHRLEAGGVTNGEAWSEWTANLP